MAYEQIVSVASTATSGQVPTANGTGGFAWQTPQGGGGAANDWEKVEEGKVTDATTITYNGQADGLANYKLIINGFVPSDTNAKDIVLQNYGDNNNEISSNAWFQLFKAQTSGQYKVIILETQMLNSKLPASLVYYSISGGRGSGAVNCYNQYNNMANDLTGLKGFVFGFVDSTITFTCDYQIWRKKV